MKLLFDENLSPKLVGLLASSFPGSVHVHAAGLGAGTDAEVWAYAQQHGCTIVSKDSDFVELSILRGAPPKLVWLRIGNCTTERAAELLDKHRLEIAALTTDDSLRYCIIE